MSLCFMLHHVKKHGPGQWACKLLYFMLTHVFEIALDIGLASCDVPIEALCGSHVVEGAEYNSAAHLAVPNFLMLITRGGRHG